MADDSASDPPSTIRGLAARIPDAEDPLALSLNENPFAPLPAVRAAMIEPSTSANRYPEFLPERFRRLIAKHESVSTDEQVIVGAGATGVVMQTLQALTRPGDRIVMATPTFDGYPIFAQMARLQTVTVPLDEHGHHDLDAMADAATDAQVVVVCRPHNPTGTVEPADDVRALPVGGFRSDTMVLLDEAYIEFVSARHRIDLRALVATVSECRCRAHLLEGVRAGRHADRVRHLLAGHGADAVVACSCRSAPRVTSLAAVAASFDAEAQLRQRIRLITAERDVPALAAAGLGRLEH